MKKIFLSGNFTFRGLYCNIAHDHIDLLGPPLNCVQTPLGFLTDFVPWNHRWNRKTNPARTYRDSSLSLKTCRCAQWEDSKIAPPPWNFFLLFESSVAKAYIHQIQKQLAETHLNVREANYRARLIATFRQSPFYTPRPGVNFQTFSRLDSNIQNGCNF